MIQLLSPRTQGIAPLKLRLSRNLVRVIKRGHPWVFAEALRRCPDAPPGSQAVLLDNQKGREIARGFYDAHSSLTFRVCTVEPGQTLDERWAAAQLNRALALRRALFDETTTAFRLFNGEGDGLPGLVCDIYNETAVIQFDGAGPAGFWHADGIAHWLATAVPVNCVYQRPQPRDPARGQGRPLVGETPVGPVPFIENGVWFTADILAGQKTGFFLDQRENRQRIRPLAADRRVLNLFGYTGGFSVYAGLGGAGQVTTVDVAGPALASAVQHWRLNGLPPAGHRTVAADAFDFLAQAAQNKEQWELVIADPPSFAPSQEAVPRAIESYRRLIAASAVVTAPDGFLAAASCSSHISPDTFLAACEEGISQARRRATLLGIYGQPADHPTPLALPEFRYLKFVLMRIE
ncbi:MAG: class I SAM-dependent rRNA methyltransferase [Chloroflexota bacterium]